MWATHRRGLFGLGNTEKLPCVERLLQDPLIADADRHQGHVEHLALDEGLHHDVQQTLPRTHAITFGEYDFISSAPFVVFFLPNFGVKDLAVRLRVPSRKNSTGA